VRFGRTDGGVPAWNPGRAEEESWMSKPFTTNELRQAFIDFFTAKQCVHHPSASLVPANDPTILFTVAGMAQFKDMFLGRGNLPFSRAVTCQKCIRTNDIMQVGRTPRHHTFFEMLGNFSFNDYFKHETIHWAWEFLTEVIGLDPERLSVSVHTIDNEAWDIWEKDIGLPRSRIFRMGDSDNFWPADAPAEGPLGPGGCCSEIFWDFQTNDDPEDNLTKDSGRFVEVWNCVFPQFNVTEPKVDGRYTLEELGRQNIDTGMGLERLACVVQGKTNNFDIDLLQTIVQEVGRVTEQPYVMNAAAASREEERNALIRRIADHVRAVTFCISDGALPGNTGRGYVVRRLIRRATLDIDKLGVEAARLHEIIPAVIEAMGASYPEIARRRDLSMQTLEAEERNFRKTLRKGLELLQRALERHHTAGEQVFSGDDAFELFTTHGFPKELIHELVAAEGLRIDEEQYQKRWAAFTAISNSKSVDVFTSTALQEAKPRLGETDFVGYQSGKQRATITLLELDRREVQTAPARSAVRVALDQTPFYGESGGQMGDTGFLTGDGFQIRIEQTVKDDGLFIHEGHVVDGTAVPGPVLAEIDQGRRAAITRHHSATHLLHAALYELLGDHIEQQGSEVRAEQLRFDYNNPAAPSTKQLQAVQDWVCKHIASAQAVQVEELAIDEARNRGAKAQFGEKYGDVVRVVSMGQPSCSVELCGGCHVGNTADIGAFRIVRDEAVAAGIRRIVAVAGEAAEQRQRQEQDVIDACARPLGLAQGNPNELPGLTRQFKATGMELVDRVTGVVQQLQQAARAIDEQPPELQANGVAARVAEAQKAVKILQRRYDEQQARAAVDAVDSLAEQLRQVGEVPVLTAELPVDAKALRQALEALRQRCPSAVIVLGSRLGGKALLVASVSDDWIERGLKAGVLVGQLARMVGGGGGGKPQIAQAGGKDSDALPTALAAVDELIAQAVPTIG